MEVAWMRVRILEGEDVPQQKAARCSKPHRITLYSSHPGLVELGQPLYSENDYLQSDKIRIVTEPNAELR